MTNKQSKKLTAEEKAERSYKRWVEKCTKSEVSRLSYKLLVIGIVMMALHVLLWHISSTYHIDFSKSVTSIFATISLIGMILVSIGFIGATASFFLGVFDLPKKKTSKHHHKSA